MEEKMMMVVSSPEEDARRNRPISDEPVTTSTYCPTWKLYENPFYNHSHHHHQPKSEHQQHILNHNQTHLHRLHLPISTRKIAASFWDLTFIRPIMDSELDLAKAQIAKLKAELEFERKARKRAESLNKKLARELSDERKGREALERTCEEVAKEVSADKAEITRMKREMEEERKMLRMAEVFREERVQMKLNEAKLLLEDKILELEITKRMKTECWSTCAAEKKNEEDNSSGPIEVPVTTATDYFSGNKPDCNIDNRCVAGCSTIQRRASPEPENPHIKRGIKGFVEFPKVVRAIGSKSRHLGTKLECQKAQLKVLLKQKSPVRSTNLIMS
ncbi:hypothetical protein NMG60_11026858 [Bertholletia excelsa]